MHRLAIAVTSLFASVLSLPSISRAQEQPQIREDVLFEELVNLPSESVNAKVRRVVLPADFKTPEHTHAGPGPRYILRGEVEIVEAGETNTYGAGEVFWETGVPMTAETLGGEEAEIVIFELLPAE